MPLQKHKRKHAHKPPPEVLPQKVEHDIEMPSTGKGERAEALPQDSGRTPKVLPPEYKLEVDALPQGSPNKGKSARDAPPQRDPSVGALAIWDPGGRPLRERTLEPKGPVEAMNIAPGIDAPQQNVAPGIVAHKKTPGCAELNQSASTIPKSQPCTFIPFSIRRQGLLSSRSPFVFIFRFEAH